LKTTQQLLDLKKSGCLTKLRLLLQSILPQMLPLQAMDPRVVVHQEADLQTEELLVADLRAVALQAEELLVADLRAVALQVAQPQVVALQVVLHQAMQLQADLQVEMLQVDPQAAQLQLLHLQNQQAVRVHSNRKC
jgi:hypothetical protein